MLRVFLKNMAAHKARLTMTGLAVVIGVAFISGTFVFSDTIEARFDSLFGDIYGGIDASVRPPAPEFGQQGIGAVNEGSMPEDILDLVAAVDGVEAVTAGVEGYAQLIAADGTPIGGQGPPTFGYAWIDEPALTPLRISADNGRPPAADDEIAIDIGTAEAHGLALGQAVEVQTSTGTNTFEIVGLANFGTTDNLAGATMTMFTVERAQELMDLEGLISNVTVVAAEGVSQETLVERIASAIPTEFEVVTGEAQLAEQLATVQAQLGFVTPALLAFAAVAVFVGAFVIQNTFRIVIAQRTRELGLLRAVGANSNQVMQMVVAEAAFVGGLGSGLGVLAGIGLSRAMYAAFDALGMGVPDGPLTVGPTAVVVGMLVGVTVTIASAILPARRAASTSPMAAIQDVRAEGKSLRTRRIVGLGTSTLGTTALVAGLTSTEAALPLVAVGAALLFLGVSTLAPLFIAPMANVLGRLFPNIAGKLARTNVARRPRRTASAAMALMIGIALVGVVGVFSASMKASITDTFEDVFPADVSVSSRNLTAGVPGAAIDTIAAMEEVDTVTTLTLGATMIDGSIQPALGVEPTTIEALYSIASSPAIEGALTTDSVFVHDGLLEANGWNVGDVVEIAFPTGDAGAFAIAGTFEDSTFGQMILHQDALLGSGDPVRVFASFANTVDEGTGLAAIEASLSEFPVLVVEDRDAAMGSATAQVDQIVILFQGLLGLAMVIATLGIANTLALSVVERIHEVGLLRAVGFQRRGVRRMIRAEAVITSLFGAVVGIGVGVGLGWAIVSSLGDMGLTAFRIPLGQLGAVLVVAVAAGLVAAALPARKASRLDVLTAISYE